MKERGIIFNGDMVRAILSGQKTQTRRVIKVDFDISDTASTRDWANALAVNCYPMPTPEQIQQKAERLHGVIHPVILDDGQMVGIRCPLGKVGDRLWVREACKAKELESGLDVVCYLADQAEIPVKAHPLDAGLWIDLYRYRGGEGKNVPSIHMPRWASRILLEITDVRVERLNDISERDAIEEGLERYNDDGIVYYGPYNHGDCRPEIAFSELWKSIYGTESWNSNPWCWAITFKRIEVA